MDRRIHSLCQYIGDLKRLFVFPLLVSLFELADYCARKIASLVVARRHEKAANGWGTRLGADAGKQTQTGVELRSLGRERIDRGVEDPCDDR